MNTALEKTKAGNPATAASHGEAGNLAATAAYTKEFATSAENSAGAAVVEGSATETATPEECFASNYEKSMRVIFKEPSKHETFYKVLCLVGGESDEGKLSKSIRALPEMKVSLRTPRYFLDTLCGSGALTREAVEDEGEPKSQDADKTRQVVSQARTMSIQRYRWYLTPVGEQLIADLSPDLRVRGLLLDDEALRPIYEEILEFCTTPRTRMDIENRLEEIPDIRDFNVATSFFVDELEQSGGLVWDDAWTTTAEGEMALGKVREKGNGQMMEEDEGRL